MTEILQRVKRLKDSASARRDFQQWEAAIKKLKQALEMLEDGIRTLDPEEDNSLIVDFATELADCYGMIGGIYRRTGDMENAADHYRKGSRYERDHALDSTYNRTNSVIVNILHHPERFGQERARIQETLALLVQRTKTPGQAGWWTWADLGQFYLLDNQAENAKYAYDNFIHAGPTARSYSSVIDVLEQLERKLHTIEPEIAAAIDDIRNYLVSARDDLVR